MSSSDHFLTTITPNKEDFNINEALTSCRNWLTNVLAVSNCVQINNKRKIRCNCMKTYLESATSTELDALANYMIHWASMHRATQIEVLHEWQQVAAFVKKNGNGQVADKQLFFRIPRTNYSICRNALCGLLGVGNKLWNTSVKRPEARVHQLKGKMADQRSRRKEMAEVEYCEALKPRRSKPIKDGIGCASIQATSSVEKFNLGTLALRDGSTGIDCSNNMSLTDTENAGNAKFVASLHPPSCDEISDKDSTKSLKPTKCAQRRSKKTKKRAQQRSNTIAAEIRCALIQDIRTVEKFNLGSFGLTNDSIGIDCVYCGALGFAAENQGINAEPCLGNLCCHHNKINIPVGNDFNLHPYIEELFTSGSNDAKYFRTHSRMFGIGMAMASVASEKGGWDFSRIGGRVSAVRVSGQLVRRIGPMMPRDGVKPTFMQTYFFEPDEATAHRISNFKSLKPDEKLQAERIFTNLHNALKEAGNTYINDCMGVKEYVEKNYPNGVDDFQISIHVSNKPSEDNSMGLKRTNSGTHCGRLNKPTVKEVSILFPNDATGKHERQVVFNLKQPATEGGIKRIRDDHRSYDPLCYPLFFNR